MKVKISSIIENQFPAFIKDEAPLMVEFIKQYYISQEYQGAPIDLISNLDEYTKIENLTELISTTTLTADISFNDTTIPVDNTRGFPDSYGLIKIDNEIITYTSKTDTTFVGCVRGFSGLQNENLEFSTSESDFHTSGATVENLSILFLKKFLEKLKKKLVPGFEGREFTDALNETNFIQKSKSFYASKGTDVSFEILFGALYGEPVKVIRPRDYLFTPSAAEYRVSKDLVVESLFGDPQLLENRTLFQDAPDGSNLAKGSISKVEQIVRGDKTYYVISLDYDFNKDINVSGSVFGQFYIHPKTRLTSASASGSTTIDVDSTVGFPNSGEIVINNQLLVTYTSKSTTQFFGCSGITQSLQKGDEASVNDFAYGYSGTDTANRVIVRITGVISDFKQIEEAYHLNVGDNIRHKSLGKTSTSTSSKHWFYNNPIRYDVKSLTSQNNLYTLVTIDDNIFVVGDNLNVVYKDGTIIAATVNSKGNENTITFQSGTPITFSSIDYVERLISRVSSTNYSSINVCASNVQNLYEDEKDNVIVASPSLPSYLGQALNVTDRSLKITSNVTGTTISATNHGFLSGDVVVYQHSGSNNHLGISNGTYYVKRVNPDTISLSSSRANLAGNNFITLSGSATISAASTICYNDLQNKTLKHQQLLRKLTPPTDTTSLVETPIGNTGILVNGVEVTNYKSKDVVFYGPIESIDVVSPGTGYDIINPPIITTTDSTGSGLVANCEVKGTLKEIRLVDRGLNYIAEPTITISGGNGKNAKAKAELGLFEHSASFQSSAITSNTIGFTTYHGFNNAEKIIYKPDGVSRVTGISTDAEYFASRVNETSIRVHKTYSDAISGINTISLSYTGSSQHRFVAAASKTKISSIVVIDEGEGYTNRIISIPSSGINTATNTINKTSHGFKTGERIVYESYTGSPISGISTNTSYYVTADDDNNFKLSPLATVGVSTSEDFFFKTNQFVTLTSSGVGTHYFNYEPITVTMYGISGVTTSSNSTFLAKIQPIFRGDITSVSIVNGGQNYGQEDILNYNRQPNITVSSGSDAVIQAIVSDGKIVQVLIINSGSGYNSPPDIIISGTGYNAQLTPIVENGQLTDVKIINSGYGYDSKNITLTVAPAGSGGLLRTNPKQWTVNLIERLINTKKISDDDGILTRSINSEYGLQYTHGYAPRKLRRIVTSSKFVNGELKYQPDLQLNGNSQEIASDSHSPIIGWAYDGNPIYGPYGYERPELTSITCMKSGYKVVSSQPNRPSTALYPEGFFIEDYQFTNEGHLDEHNGRYCITPEFPNGTYAYFASIDGSTISGDGPFVGYYRPVFPYIIGPTYHSKPIDFNFDYKSNQELIDLNKTGWVRNTAPLKLSSSTSTYDYLLQPFDIIEQTTTVTSTISGSVESVRIISGGDDYKVKDRLVFNNNSTGGSDARAEVSLIGGKDVSTISVASTSFFNVEFTPDSQYGIIGFSTIPHGFEANDVVSVKNLNYNRSVLQDTFNIGVVKQTLTLNTDVKVIALTGITTYFNVYGNLNYPSIRENDIFLIDNEKVKVLNVDKNSSRLFVERAYGGTVGSYHTVGAALSEVPRKFFINKTNQNFNNSFINKELYFNPAESLGVGLGTTVTFSNPGSGITNIFVPTRSVYFPEHGLNTGERLTYRLNGGSEITVSTNGITTSLLNDNTTLYAVRYSDNLIGFSTEKVGVGSTGNFVGYNTTSAAKILYYHTTGSGQKHSIVTNYDSTIGQVDRNLVSVYTKTEPQLINGDIVNVTAKPTVTRTIQIVYNKATQRLLANPKAFLASDVDTTKETIRIANHGYFTGQKVLYTATSPISGLTNNGIYYVAVINSNLISLCRTYYDATLDSPNIIALSSATSGTISEINPRIKATKNNTLVFDVSDTSLSVLEGAQSVPAFDFKIFTDNQFVNEFRTTYTTTTFNVTKSGTIGNGTNATVTLKYDVNVPNELYYNLVQLKTLPVFVDDDYNNSHNIINFVDSSYSGTYAISGVGSTSFSYSITSYPESDSYSTDVTYTTTSKTATGSIEQVSLISGGVNYKTLPGISSVISDNGYNAIFDVDSTSIGRINNVNINDIGFDYPSDLTLRPLTQTPVVLKVIPQSNLKSVGIVSQGRNYISAPNLVLVDGLTLKQIPDVVLQYTLGDDNVTIVKNSKGINNITPLIIPINNSNAIGISSISYDSTTKSVTAVLSESYSTLDDFPFVVGDKVLVENVSIVTDSSAKGYNSSFYDYARFTVTSITPNLGFAGGSITYSLADYLKSSEYPGTQNTAVASGTIIPEKFFPIFNIQLTKNSFLRDETVTSGDVSGLVQYWNSDNELLTVSTSDEFVTGSIIIGSDSRSSGVVDKIYNFKSYYEVDATSIVKKGWQTEKGFLDNEFQRIQDNNYYQAFAYSLKSKVDYETWNNAVSSLNHIAGFKKFSDLIVESDAVSGIGSSQTVTQTDLVIFSESEVNLNCVQDFDLATENNYLVGDQISSNQIYFKGQILDDYSEVIGNRVLTIDDISSNFDDETREFDLKNNGLGIFERTFNGSSSTIVDINSNVLNISNHYFTNGEKVTYSNNGSPIGIKTTTIGGIGSTDKLPPTVYVVKYSESTIGLSDTAENALKEVPVPLIFTSVGTGSSHTLTATNQNTKALISMGGVIQAPVVATAVSTRASMSVGVGSTVLYFDSIASFASGDYAKLDDEIVKVVTVGSATTNDVQVNRGWAGTAITTHTSNTTVYKVSGDYNIVGSKLHFLDPPKGPTPIGTTTGSPENVDFVGITTTLDFNGRVFLRNGEKNTTNEAYGTNYLFDDISNSFNGITSSFTLKVNNQNVNGFSNNNGSLLIGEVFQSPSDLSGVYKTYGSYIFEESSGITSVRFLGSSSPQNYDVNAASIPVGGVIVSIGYTQGFGLQPLVAAGGTAVVSTAGTIQSVSIGNSGSGYRSGVQVVNVGIYVSTTGISTVRNIGIASVLNGRVVSVAITNPGTGYTSTNPPIVKFDDPYPYTNLPLQYVSPSSGVGTGARANVRIGMGLSVIDLELSNKGFAYKKGDVLSVSIGGTVGIPTVSSASYSDFKIVVDEVYNQKFSAWTFGELQIIDSIENLFNGTRKTFPIKVDNEIKSIRAKVGSPIDIKSTLLIFINGILQIPGEGYNFNGGSFIIFTEAPKSGYSCLVLFYRGTGSTDVVDVDVVSPIKAGDRVQLNDVNGLGQSERIVSSINSSDSVNTIPYSGPNVSDDDAYVRPLRHCRQTEDIFINQKVISKDREIYEPLIEPSTNVIKTIGITSTIIFVENVRTFFDDQRENALPIYKNKLCIISQDDVRPAIATATVSTAGTVASVTIVDGGKGYTTSPIVSFTNPIGLTTASRAYATATVTSGSISSIIITSPGTGYTATTPPQVLVSNPSGAFESVTATSLTGDFGIISGISTTSVGVASTGLIFNLYIPPESVLRNGAIAGAAITVSGIQTGYYFVANNTFVGNGNTSLDESGSIISIGSSYLDNVYRVANVSIGQSFVAGIGTTTVAMVTVSVTNNNITGIGFTQIYGTYSWGRITIASRKTANSFTVYNNGLTGVSTSPIVKRINPLRYKNYT